MRFDLLDEPWIRVRTMDGALREVSLLEVFSEAGSFRALAGDVPTQDVAILRLLLAVLHRSIGADATEDDWHELWQRQELPVDAVRSYLETWRRRFDLLDGEAPFYQVAGLHTAKDELFGLERLIADIPNGEAYMTTRAGAGREHISLAEAARWLVHVQAFDPSGIKSGAVGDERVKGGKGYPIGVAFAGWLGCITVERRTLAETLLLNLVIDESRTHPDDAPAWEREPLGAGPRARSQPSGPLDLLTWQGRRIRLAAESGRVAHVLICNGDPLHPRNLLDLEHMTGWRRSEAQEKQLGKGPGDPVYMPRAHPLDRQVWRGLGPILAHEETASVPPRFHRARVLEWLRGMAADGLVDRGALFQVRTSGVVYGTQNAVIDGIVDDALHLQLALLDSPALRDIAVHAVTDAEQTALACANLASDLAQAAGGERDAPRSAALSRVYDDLDPQFRAWLADLGPAHSGESSKDLHRVRAEWQRTCLQVARRAGADLVAQAGEPAWIGRRDGDRIVDAGTAEVAFERRLRDALPLTVPEGKESP